MTPMKTCGACGEEKRRSEFYIARTKPDGHMHWCKLCQKDYNATRAAQDITRWHVASRSLTLPSPSACGVCHQRIYDGSDWLGYGTLTCGCGTSYVPRRRVS